MGNLAGANKEDQMNYIRRAMVSAGFNEDEIIQKFILFIMGDVKYTLDIKKLEFPSLFDNNIKISVIELVIYEKIVTIIIDMINKIHYIQFIQSISLFFDGIPSYSKILDEIGRRLAIGNFKELKII